MSYSASDIAETPLGRDKCSRDGGRGRNIHMLRTCVVVYNLGSLVASSFQFGARSSLRFPSWMCETPGRVARANVVAHFACCHRFGNRGGSNPSRSLFT
eukprot:869252-Amorphochlora_amoeboformis.AAC.2